MNLEDYTPNQLRLEVRSLRVEIEQLTKQRDALLEAGRRSLNWLSSYPGGNAERCYDQMRKAVDPLDAESTKSSD